MQKAELSKCLNSIRNEFSLATVAFQRDLERIAPRETPYAFLFEINDQNPGAWPIAATEESLSRLAASYMAKGYKGKNGNDLELLRCGLRWDAPGDAAVGWYWGGDSIHERLNALLAIAFDHTFGDSSIGYQLLKTICLTALEELDAQGTFGKGPSRERVVIGVSNVDLDFELFQDELSLVNPHSVFERLRSQLAQATTAWDQISRPSRNHS
ncbi:MAG: hypothetical protein JWM11_4209 [Planctomycetaceae bacterium]|nr:hypothetical protein [Planctomycetaceae bacterium]